MTEKLYYCAENPTSCDAVVMDCRERDGAYHILLDRTVLFPESGGQLSDTGAISKSPVTHAYEEGDDVWHETQRAFAVGERVTVTLDVEPRTDHTVQHTGEHILSGLASSLFGAVNVGFHMAKDYVTIDFDKPLSDEELETLEREANAAVRRCVPTAYEIVDGAELEHKKLRKQAKGLSGEIRIVYAGGVDSCTCCGTHCQNSGEVGAIKITDAMKYKGGVRLTFACGARAVLDAQKNARTVKAVTKRFSVKTEDVYDAVVKQGDELSAAKRMLRARTDELMGYRARELFASAVEAGGTKLVVTLENELPMQDIKTLAEKICANKRTVAVVLSKCGDALLYQLMRGEGAAYSMKDACAAVNAMLSGKGGGRDEAAAGSAKAAGGLTEAVEQLTRYFVQVLKA